MPVNKRILIFNVNWLGDVLFSTAVIRNLRRTYPEAFIACAIPARCNPVLKGNPHLNEVIIYDEKKWHKSIVEKMNFVRFLKSRRFDTVFLLHRSLSRALICRLANIPERIGYDEKGRGFLLTKKIPPARKDTMHRIDYYLNVIKEAGIEIVDRHLDFYFTEEDALVVGKLLKRHSADSGSFIVGLNPGGNWLPKRWPAGHWALLADALISRLKAKVIFTGAQNDLPLISQIKKNMKTEPIVVAGELDVNQFGALAKRLDLFVSADSGPLHIANAVGTRRIIALFGPTSEEITGPFPLKGVTVMHKNVGCKIPCYVVDCVDNRCMQELTPDEVFLQAEASLKQTS